MLELPSGFLVLFVYMQLQMLQPVHHGEAPGVTSHSYACKCHKIHAGSAQHVTHTSQTTDLCKYVERGKEIQVLAEHPHRLQSCINTRNRWQVQFCYIWRSECCITSKELRCMTMLPGSPKDNAAVAQQFPSLNDYSALQVKSICIHCRLTVHNK